MYIYLFIYKYNKHATGNMLVYDDYAEFSYFHFSLLTF